MENMELYIKAVDAAARFFERKYDAEILEKDPCANAPIICRIIENGEEKLVFVNVSVRSESEGFEKTIDRGEMEAAAIVYLINNPQNEISVRFDDVCMIVTAENRALMRHEVNALR